jgi:hypothetical protein
MGPDYVRKHASYGLREFPVHSSLEFATRLFPQALAYASPDIVHPDGFESKRVFHFGKLSANLTLLSLNFNHNRYWIRPGMHHITELPEHLDMFVSAYRDFAGQGAAVTADFLRRVVNYSCHDCCLNLPEELSPYSLDLFCAKSRTQLTINVEPR